MEILVGGIEKTKGNIKRLMVLRPWECEVALIRVKGIKAVRIVHCKAVSSWEKISGGNTVIKARVRILALNRYVAV